MYVEHYLPRALPGPLQGLGTLALDLRWSWHHGTDALWRSMDPDLWEATRNPWLILETVSARRLAELEADPAFTDNLERLLAERDAHYGSETWFPAQYAGRFTGAIAYFSMEWGISESLPLYSGGLGVLAGDLLKTACDLDVPIVGVGLLYQQGYFRQTMNARGEQLAFNPFNDPTMLPVVPLRDDDGEWVRVPVELPGRTLHLRAWLAEVGRRSLFLLDSNDPLNEPGDRGITSELYGGGSELRLQQEYVLGIGGYRLLQRMGIDCPVLHLNEGHTAFATLERARQLMASRNTTFDEARFAARAGTLFTTHTPVEAGFDRFGAELARVYLEPFASEVNADVDDLLGLGQAPGAARGAPFNMAWLAVRGAGAVNGVSALHGEVSRVIFQSLFPRWPRDEVPVGHVTNGVHVPTWDSADADALWTRACGKDRWRGTLESLEAALHAVDDDALWHMRCSARRQLVGWLRGRIRRQRISRGTPRWLPDEHAELFDPDAMTIGFARRFAEYKRTNLLLHDERRLLELLCNRDRPVQLVIAGKAHPGDETGKSLLRDWLRFLGRPEVRNRVAFVEDYDLAVAAELVQGVDVWINTPRRPWEACGTSGMKVLVNGGLNLSVADGWWAEAYAPELGWALGDGAGGGDAATADARDARRLYELLENDVIPTFYARDAAGLPRDWIRLMRESMARLTTRFSSNRMLREYVTDHYLPLAAQFRARTGPASAELLRRLRELETQWPHVRFGNVTHTEGDGRFEFEVQAYLDALQADDVDVQLYADATAGRPAVCASLQREDRLADAENAWVFRGTVDADRPAEAFTPRIVPAVAQVSVPLEASTILWYR